MTRSHPHASLRRSLGIFGAGAFVVTNMIGTGIFTIPAFVRVTTGSGLSSLSVWAVGALLAVSGGLCYAELATRMPRVGGEYYYLTRVFSPLWGFLSGWVSFFVGFSAVMALGSIGAFAYLAAAIGSWDSSAPFIAGLGIDQASAAAAAFVLFLGLVHSFGIRPSGRLQTALATLVLSACFLLVVAGLASGNGDWRGVTAGGTAAGSWWVALIEVSFAYSGWNAAAYLAGEVRSPRKTLPWALLGGTAVVAATYLALNMLFLYAIPADAWQEKIAVGEQAATYLFGPGGARWVAALILVALLGTISAMTAAGPRIYYAMAADGLGPKAFARVSARSQVPVVAILSQSVVAALLALTGAFEMLLVYVGSVLLLFNALTAIAVFVVRRSDNGDKDVFRLPGYPFTPALFLLVVIVAWAKIFVDQPRASLAALATILVGVLIYFLGVRYGWITFNPAHENETPDDNSPLEALAETP